MIKAIDDIGSRNFPMQILFKILFTAKFLFKSQLNLSIIIIKELPTRMTPFTTRISS